MKIGEISRANKEKSLADLIIAFATLKPKDEESEKAIVSTLFNE